MAGWMMDRMVERAIPPGIEDPTQERIAEAAAENGIRQTVIVIGIAGMLVVLAVAALLYGFLPSRQVAPGEWQPSEMAARVVTNEAKLRQAVEEAERQFQQVAMERAALQSTVADLVARLGEQANRQLQSTSAAVVSKDPGERERLQRTIGDLERQVADLTQKLQATSAAVVSQDPGERERLQRTIGDLERQVADLTQKLQAGRAAVAVDRSARIPPPALPSNPPAGGSPAPPPSPGRFREMWPPPAPGGGSWRSGGPDVR